MARKITGQAIKAFYNAQSFNKSNTIVKITEPYKGCQVSTLTLFGNVIAYLSHKTNTLTITNAGYKTVTTKERLNGLDGVNIHQSKNVWYLNGVKWNGEPTIIN